MSLELCILASGSMGNCSILRTPSGLIMIDAGIGPRSCAKRMAGTGVCVADIRAMLLTHLDSDHFRAGWIRTIVARELAVYCHRAHRPTLESIVADAVSDAGLARAFLARVTTFDGKPFVPLKHLRVQAIQLLHDSAGSTGFLLSGYRQRVGYATDLGAVPPKLIEHFADLNILAIESNYDPAMELHSARPDYVKRRVMGGHGHLSNQQAFDLTRAILDRQIRLPDHIVLLHRSRQCNCPKLLRRLFESDLRIGPRLTLAEQFERSEWLRPRQVRPHPGEQLTLAWTAV